jgi:hypothetical protein
MTAPVQLEVIRPELTELLELLGLCGQVVSFFLKPKQVIAPAFGTPNPLAKLFTSEAFQTLAGELGAISPDLGRYSTLNRYEFEGSLVSVAVAGGCHGSTADVSRERIRAVVSTGLAAVFPAPFDDVHVFRLDDERWCRATEEATLSTSYVAWQSARGIWWVLCVTDID